MSVSNNSSLPAPSYNAEPQTPPTLATPVRPSSYASRARGYFPWYEQKPLPNLSSISVNPNAPIPFWVPQPTSGPSTNSTPSIPPQPITPWASTTTSTSSPTQEPVSSQNTSQPTSNITAHAKVAVPSVNLSLSFDFEGDLECSAATG